MSEEKKKFPELRFPEFETDGEWEIKSIEKNIDLISGIALKSKELSEDKSGTPILRGINITEGEIRHSDEVDRFYLGDTSEIEKYLVEENDIVIGMDGSKVGKNVALISENDAGSILIQRVARIRALEAVTDYLYQYFLSQDFRRYVDVVNTSSGIPHISQEQIRKYKVGFPPKVEEQQKIAGCLSSLDELISTHNDKLELLKDHKKGLLQNLFPKKGDKEPIHRLPEFENDGEWMEKKLGEIGDPKMCKRIFKDQTTPNPKDGIPFYKIGTFDGEADAYISKELYEEYKSNYNFPNKGDILISASGTIGRLVVYDGAPAYFQDSNIVWLENDENLILNTFLYYCYSIVEWQTSDGGVIKRLYNSDLKNIAIQFPKEKAEQQKIASSLSAVDELINDQVKMLEQLDLHKKGLVQGLFPKNDK